MGIVHFKKSPDKWASEGDIRPAAHGHVESQRLILHLIVAALRIVGD